MKVMTGLQWEKHPNGKRTLWVQLAELISTEDGKIQVRHEPWHRVPESLDPPTNAVPMTHYRNPKSSYVTLCGQLLADVQVTLNLTSVTCPSCKDQLPR